MKNGRLFQILYLLMEHRELTAVWLAQKLEVSVRTIYRDVDALSAAGIPIYTQQGQGGGIRLMEQFQIDRSLLDEEEQESILTALHSLGTLGAVQDKEVLSRLSVIFQKKPVEWLDIDFESWGSRENEKDYFEQCRKAILSRHLLTFTYSNAVGETKKRTAEPLQLCFKGGNWYLSAFSREKEDYRLFRLSRMEELCTLPDRFLPRELPPKENRELGDPNPLVFMELKITENSAFQVLDIFAPEEIQRLPEGGFLVKTPFLGKDWTIGFLLSFGKELEVLGPSWIRELVAEEIRKMKDIYET